MITRRSFLRATGLGVGAALGPLSALGQPHPAGPVPHLPIPVGPAVGPAIQPVVAIVLAGGGAKGSFEVGIVRYLYDHGISPNILCGTSVGAINAAKLAEGEGDPTRGLPGLESIWLRLKENSDMYQKEPWLQSLMSGYPQLFSTLPSSLFPSDPDPPGIHVVATSTGTSIPGGNLFTAVAAAPARFQAWLLGFLVDVVECKIGCDIAQSIVNQSPKALYNLSPIEFLLAEHLNMALIQQWAASGGKLRLATVGLESGKVRYVTESGQLLDRDNSTIVYTIPPLQVEAAACQGLLAQVKQIDLELRGMGQPPPEDDPGYADWYTQNADLVHQLDQAEQALAQCRNSNPPSFIPDILTGVLASAALPCAFLPVKLGDENYVDGGVRDDMPVEMAAILGATVIYAVNDSPPLGRDRDSYDDANLLDIAKRVTTGILVDEVVHEAETSVPNTGKVEVHEIRCTYARDEDTVTVHPALIRINMSYGYMRAADTVNPVPVRPDRCYQLADDITKLRRLLFESEAGACSASLTDLPLLRWGKGMLRLLLKERESLGGAIPQEIYQSWPNWEQHVGWTPGTPTYLAAMNGVPAITNSNQFVPEDGTLLQERPSARLGSAPPPPPGPNFLILGGAKFMVANVAELSALGLQAAPINGVPVGSMQYLPDIPREGTLIKERTSTLVYLIQDGAKHLITNPDNYLSSHGLSQSSVLIAPDGSLSSIPSGWSFGDLSAIAGAPDALGDPAGYLGSGGTNCVVYRGANSHIYLLYDTWRFGDLSAIAGAPDALGDPAGYLGSGGTNCVVYRGANSHIYLLYDTWRFGDLSAIAGAPDALGDPAGYAGFGGTNCIAYRGASSHIYLLYSWGDTWRFGDLSAIAGAPDALGDPAGYLGSGGTNCVVYRGANSHIYLLIL